MYRECFLYSEEKISSKPKSNMIYIHSNDSETFVCKQIPHFAFFKIPIHIQKEWLFYANEKPVKININNSISVPFYKLQDLLDNTKQKSGIEAPSSISEISHALYSSFDKWFHNDDENLNNDDIIIFFKIISTNFPFNHFSSMYNKMHPAIKQELLSDTPNQIEITFKKFLLSVRPNGRPNPQPLFNFTTSFLMFFHQLKYSEFFLSQRKFVTSGIHYILEYLHNDNEWGPYSVLSFLSRQLEINNIQSYPLNNYNIDQNPEFFFDKKNLKCIEECASVFGKISLLWCYNPCFHNDFIKIEKKIFGKRGKKINQKDLFNIILSRICQGKNDELTNVGINDYSSFYKFVQIVSPETDNNQIFFEIYKMFFTNNSESTKLIPFKFKLFYEGEIKGQIKKQPEKLSWINLLEEQKQQNLNQDLIYSFFDADNNNNNETKFNHDDMLYHLSDEDDDYEQQDEIDFNFGNPNHIFLSKPHKNDNDDDISPISSNNNLNIHHIILSTSLLNDDMDLQRPVIDDDQIIENFDEWPIMRERFSKTEVKFIKQPEYPKESDENAFAMPFNFTLNSSTESIFDENQENPKPNLSGSQKRQKAPKESKPPQIADTSRERTSSII